MNWIRISVAIADDPRLHLLAQKLGVRVAEAIGLVVALLTKFPEHAPKGDLSAVADSLLEKWSVWEGKRGRFAAEFRATFLSELGIWTAWEKHNGAAQREHIKNRERAQSRRDKAREQLDLTLNSPKSTPDGTADGTPDGAALRTNEQQYRGRARARERQQPTRGARALRARAPERADRRVLRALRGRVAGHPRPEATATRAHRALPQPAAARGGDGMSPEERIEMQELRERVNKLGERARAAEARVRELETAVQEIPLLRSEAKQLLEKNERMAVHIQRLIWEKNAILDVGWPASTPSPAPHVEAPRVDLASTDEGP